MGEPIAGLPGHFLGDFSHGGKLGIKDLAAPGQLNIYRQRLSINNYFLLIKVL
jgi:hypothetical protein